ncbi:dermonecrotic toxin domain-containing protein [Pseudomonas sp. NPDC090201]|uniref:dermonecrotic toxin domain-containing protein n=1 Tax=Pseudomonas sp. NPDC090201 TaxID=3364475 RepID=UPI003826D3FF
MNDISIALPRSSDRRDCITRQMADLTRASASSNALLSRHPSLRERACELLVEALKDVDLKQACGVSSPHALFFNQFDNSGRIHSVAMSDLLVDAMRHGHSVVDIEGAGFFTRHDSIGHQSAVPYDLSRQLQDTVTRFAPILPGYYRARLLAPWSVPDANPQNPSAKPRTQSETLAGQHRRALQCEVELRGYSGMLSADEQKRLADVLETAPANGVFSLVWTTTDGTRVTVPSIYVASQAGRQEAQPSGVVFLIMPARGIERYESIDLLREALSGPLADVVKDFLLIRDQLRLQSQATIGLDAWHFEPMSDALIDVHVQAVECKQMKDCNFLLTQDGNDADRSTFYAELERVHTCAHLDDAMGHRFIALTAQMTEILQPDWRKYADFQKKDKLLQLEQANDESKNNVDELFGAVTSLEDFAYREITHFMSQHLGRFVDPNLVQITLHDSIELGGNETLAATCQKSLMEFALQGLPEGAGSMTFSPSPDQIHVDFSARFVTGMLDLLDLHRRYEQELHRIAADDESLRVMARHRDCAIALGAFSARMQGHLLQDRSVDLVQNVRTDAVRNGVVHSIGSLHLAFPDTRFKDVIVIEEKTAFDDHYVLYAPGSPNGRDFYEFATWRQLSHEVGGWLAAESGRNYVGRQLAGANQSGVISTLNSVLLKPSTWGVDSCKFVRSIESGYENRLLGLVRVKALRGLSTRHYDPQLSNRGPANVKPSQRAMVDSRIEALNEELARLSPNMLSLRDYAHKKASHSLNSYLQHVQYLTHVDPDTLYFGLGVPATDTPNFNELPSFTDLMMYGSEDVHGYWPQVHLYSSVGQNIQKFPASVMPAMSRAIRKTDVAVKYMKYLTDEFLKPTSPNYKRRQTVHAQRLAYEMLRGAMTEFVKGHLDPAQYSWLSQIITPITGGASKPTAAGSRNISPFIIAGYRVEGVYCFRDDSANEPRHELLYTPGAPDGRDFRPLTDYAQLLGTAEMQSYYLARVAHEGQMKVGTFMDMLDRGGKYNPKLIKIVYWTDEPVRDFRQLYSQMIDRMIRDVDSATVSIDERQRAVAWKVIDWTVTIVTLPFPQASFAWSVLTTSLKFVEAAKAYDSGDRGTALKLFAEGVIGLIGIADEVRVAATGAQSLKMYVASPVIDWAWKKLQTTSVYRMLA